ncbi:RyR domain-containing protein [Streptomyces africanus]|uniref:RyR domain-containing protein n=1 Tax=Streptomyces africanus TaxID=231024 RepID=UPI0013025CEB|nr:RyR domain-containing protein [Streptomyces africanus]
MAQLIKEVKDPTFRVVDVEWPESIHPRDGTFHHSYAHIARYVHPQTKSGLWTVDGCPGLRKGLHPSSDLGRLKIFGEDDSPADLVVLDDEDLGFRNHGDLWPKNLIGQRSWVLLKMGGKIAEGKLWKYLYSRLAERLIVVLDIKDLRQGDIEVSKDRSWEHTARDLAGELLHKPSLNALSRCAFVIVHFGPVGALLLEHSDAEWLPRFKLWFDPDKMEGDYEPRTKRVWGHTSVLSTAIAQELMRMKSADEVSALAKANMEHAIHQGLLAMRELDRTGYNVKKDPPTSVEFPYAQVKKVLSQSQVPASASGEIFETAVEQPTQLRQEFFDAEVHRPLLHRQEFFAGREMASRKGQWTILRQKHPPETLDELAELIVKRGADNEMKDVPRGRFGKLLTVDRQEIEEFRSIRSLVDEHCRGSSEKPLSLAVFGAPGSGKSFAVMQVLEPFEGSEGAALGGEIKELEFNLSQFTSVDDLVDAFHLVRDVRLKGKIPVVFWDEFDASFDGQELGWLRYFLSPMQDGSFREGAAIHPIGQCIFAFAGGRSNRFREFRGILKDDDAFRAAKGPDFLSRIRGYIDIRGPNKESGIDGLVEAGDPYFIIRRAVTLRSLLWTDRKDLFRPPVKSTVTDGNTKKSGADLGGALAIDDGILHAFLNISKYEHGVRSMKAIIEMSSLSGKDSFDRSCLPPITQLDLHVDGREFLSLMRNLDLPGTLDDTLDAISIVVYARLCKGEAARRSHAELKGDSDNYKFPGRVSEFDELAPEDRDQFKKFVRSIPNMLGDEGYRIVPAPKAESVNSLASDVIEILAQKEHERWMNFKLKAEWKHGTSTDIPRKLHQSLMPWDELPHWQKELEMQRVSVIPYALMKAAKFAVQYYVMDTEE